MLSFTDNALILTVDKFGDHDAIVSLFCAEHGLVRGVVKRGLTSKNRADIQPATLVEATWKARLPEHMGSITLEAKHSFATRVMSDALKLSAVGSVMAMMAASLAERDAHPELYVQTVTFLQHVAAAESPRPHRGRGLGEGGATRAQLSDNPPHLASPPVEERNLSADTAQLIWLAEYVRLELALLELAGFGLDLTACAATGATEQLTYVSPKSGRAVSKAAGAPYHDRMLALPAFIKDGEHVPESFAQVGEGIALTGHFLETRLLPALHRKPPALRAHFTQLLARKNAS